MSARTLFPTRLYEADIAEAKRGADLIAELEHAAQVLAREDRAGRAWCKAHGYGGYTSYSSLDDLPRRMPEFAELKRRLDRHVAAFGAELGFDGGKPKLDSLWVNLLKPGAAHSGHIHPRSVVSGTLYLAVPEGAGAIRFEDPRLPLMMHAPHRRPDLPESQRAFFTVAPRPGVLLLWESWLRHEVLPNAARTPRISVSFNHDWT